MAYPQAIPGQYAELETGNVQPTNVFAGVVDIQASHDEPGFGGREVLVQGDHAMDVQSLPRTLYGIVENDGDYGGVRIGHVRQPLHPAGEVQFGAPLDDGRMAPARQRLPEELVVVSTRMTRWQSSCHPVSVTPRAGTLLRGVHPCLTLAGVDGDHAHGSQKR